MERGRDHSRARLRQRLRQRPSPPRLCSFGKEFVSFRRHLVARSCGEPIWGSGKRDLFLSDGAGSCRANTDQGAPFVFDWK